MEGYFVNREILDEERLEQMSQRLDPLQTHKPFSHRIKNSLRYDAAFKKIM